MKCTVCNDAPVQPTRKAASSLSAGALPYRRVHLIQPSGEVGQRSKQTNLQTCQIANSGAKKGESTPGYADAIPVNTRVTGDRRVGQRGDPSAQTRGHAHYLSQDRIRRQICKKSSMCRNICVAIYRRGRRRRPFRRSGRVLIGRWRLQP